jgi:DNA-binding CsgD family transcriptional regulator
MREAQFGQDLDLSLLSRREGEVLDVAIEGLSVRHIAERLCLTEATVRSHLSATYSKLGVSGRVELLARLNGEAEQGRGTGRAADAAGRARRTEGERSGKRLVSLRTLSFWAYALTYGALFGYAGYDPAGNGGSNAGMIYVWYGFALAGSILILLKNRRLGDHRLKARIYLADLAVVVAALALIAVLPASLGMLKGPLLLTLFCPYIYWYLRTLKTEGLA